MWDEEAFRRAQVSARRTPTFLLRRQERRIVAQHNPATDQLVRLAAVRRELTARGRGRRDTDMP